jgi:hypothetical protein
MMCCHRELVLQCRGLERRLQELQGLETRHSDVLDELNDYKFKVGRGIIQPSLQSPSI